MPSACACEKKSRKEKPCSKTVKLSNAKFTTSKAGMQPLKTQLKIPTSFMISKRVVVTKSLKHNI